VSLWLRLASRPEVCVFTPIVHTGSADLNQLLGLGAGVGALGGSGLGILKVHAKPNTVVFP